MELQNTDWSLVLWTAFWTAFFGLAVFLIVRYMLRQLKNWRLI